jgi:hypothetical protein
MSAETDEKPKTLSVPEAGKKYFDLCPGTSYEAARRGELPVIRVGRRVRVPVRALEAMLDSATTIRDRSEAEHGGAKQRDLSK